MNAIMVKISAMKTITGINMGLNTQNHDQSI